MKSARPLLLVRLLFLLLVIVPFAALASTPVSEDVAGERAELDAMAEATLADLYQRQPKARELISKSAGYAVFSNFGMKLLVSGSGKGKGVAISSTSGRRTYMRMLELQAGLGFGIKKFRLVWVFDTKESFDKFVKTGRQLGGQAGLSAKGRGVAGAIPVEAGIWLYQLTDKGIAAEVTVKASKYFKDKDLN